MLNKIKIFICGFISCIVIFNIPTVIAAVEEYTLQRADFGIVVNGEEYKDDELPILVMEGNTYIPLKKFCDISGMNINWNEEIRKVEINSNINNININNGISNINPSELIGKEISINDKKLIFTEDEETKALYLEVDGTKYVQEAFVFQAIASPTIVYKFRRDESITKDFQFRNDLYIHEIINDQIVVENIPTVIYQGMDFIDYDFYVNNIEQLKVIN